MRQTAYCRWRWVLAVFFIAAGGNHFLNPGPYLSMMPAYLPWPLALVWISGVAEMMGGLCLLRPKLQVVAAWGLIVLLVAVFPANVNVAVHGWPGVSLPQWSLWVRLPLQGVFVWWIYIVCIRGETKKAFSAGSAR